MLPNVWASQFMVSHRSSRKCEDKQHLSWKTVHTVAPCRSEISMCKFQSENQIYNLAFMCLKFHPWLHRLLHVVNHVILIKSIHVLVKGKLSLNLNVWSQWIISSEEITEKLFLGVYRRVIASILNATIYKSHESQASSSIFSKLVIRLPEGFYGSSNLPQVVFVSPAFPHIWQWVKATTSKE